MKKLIIAGSSKLQERIAYWRGYFEGRGYEVIDYPAAITTGDDYVAELTDIYCSFYQNLERADVFFLMNEDKDGIGGYIGPSAFAELSYAITGNLNRGKKYEILLLQEPSQEQACAEEVQFWLERGWVKIYNRPSSKRDPKPAPVTSAPVATPPITLPASAPKKPEKPERTINILTCRKRCLRHLDMRQREYLSAIAPEFPAWLLKYIAAPEFQRLNGVNMVGNARFTNINDGPAFNSVYTHSIGVALIIWGFTHDKRQTLAGLFHDIASPAFKHTIDYLNGDSETQESTEARTNEIIRNSRTIMRQLKRDSIMAGEISDYKLYPLADNDVPGLAADRLEYTLSNGYFAYEFWTLDQIRTFMNDIIVLKNENDLEEFGFGTLEVAEEFTKENLNLSATYHNDVSRANMQFMADILKSMFLRNYLSLDDLYTMSEREIVDWILSCGDKTISEAFRQFQRSTTVYHSNTIKKDRYCTSVKSKVRYIVPLVQGANGASDQRITDLSKSVHRAVQKYLAAKQPKYVGFDFEFTPYTA